VVALVDGRKYEGSCLDGDCHGEGKGYLPDGTMKRGIWENGIFVKTLEADRKM